MTGARWEAGRFGIPATDVRLRLGSLMQLHIGRRAVALHFRGVPGQGQGQLAAEGYWRWPGWGGAKGAQVGWTGQVGGQGAGKCSSNSSQHQLIPS